MMKIDEIKTPYTDKKEERGKMKYIKIKWLRIEPLGEQKRFLDFISEKDYLEYELDKILGNFDDFDIESTELLIEHLVDGILGHLTKKLSEKQKQYLMFNLKIYEVIHHINPAPTYKALEVLHIEKQEKLKKEQQ